MSTINYTYNVIVDRFRQFAAGHFQLRRFTHGEISQADLEKEAEWPWLHVKPRAINYSPGTRSFSFEIFISDLPRDKEDKTGYQAESITDCSLIFQDLINEIYLGNMFGDQVVLSRPVNSEPFVEQYTHTLTGVTGTIELNLDYDWSACSIPASWNYNTPTDSPSDGWGALQFIESLDQNGVFVSLLNDEEAPGNSYYYGTNASGVKGWYAIVDNIGLTCETLPNCAVIISIEEDIAALQAAAITNTSQLVNDGEDGINPFITAQDIPSLTGYVPYTGATADVDLGTHNLTADHIGLNVNPSGAGYVVGATRWNNTIGSSETLLKGGTVSLKNGVDLVARVVNKVTPNTTLTKAAYQAVRVSGAQGQRLAVELAQANNDNNSADTIGIVCETIATNQEGFIQTVGQLESINTTGSLQGETWTDGDVLYLSPTTAGRLTNIKPTGATGHIVVIGYVEYAHANNGKIYVKIMNGWELDELHNVYITSPANNQGLFYDSADQLWKNETIASALGYTPFNLPALTSGSVLFSNGTTIAQDNANLFFDDTNNRLGIGTATPLNTLDVAGTVRLLSGSSSLTLNNATFSELAYGTTNYFRANGSSAIVQGPQILFLVAAIERARIFATTGNVGINTTTDAGFKLDVNGTARVQGTTTITPATLTGTAATSALDIAQTWNTTGTPTAIKLNITDTASNGNSRLLDIQVGGSSKFIFVKNGNLFFGALNNSSNIQGDDTTRGLILRTSLTTTVGSGFTFSNLQGNVANLSSTSNGLYIQPAGTIGFNPTSGTGLYNSIQINDKINQTGGASGITRGLYINPTLTAAADFRAIETTAGRVVISDTATVTGTNATSLLDLSQTWNTTGAPIALKVNITDTASAALSDLISLQVGGSVRFRVLKSGFFTHNTGGEIVGNLVVGGSSIDASSQVEVRSTTRGFLPPRMTTTQKNAIATPAAGLVVYDTTLNKLCVRGAAAWETITSV